MLRPPATTAQPQPVSTVRRHHLVLGTASGIARFAQLPSACTGVCPSPQWAQRHASWTRRGCRGVLQYVLPTGGGPLSVACADYQCVMPASGNALSGPALRALVRPPALTRPAVGVPSHVVLLPASAAAAVGNADDDAAATRAAAAAADTSAMPAAVPSRAGAKHSHCNAYVMSTVFFIVECHDARTLDMARACVQALDEQCQLLNPHSGSVPLFVFVALSIEAPAPAAAGSIATRGSGADDDGSSSTAYLPEVLFQDVAALARQDLRGAQSRVDDVTLVLSA